MRNLVGVCLVALFCGGCGSEGDPPEFSDYAATTYQGPYRIPVDYADYSDDIRSSGPNFAGEYALIEHLCGGPCVTYTAVNLRTGAVTSFPVDPAEPKEISEFYLENRLDSSLIKATWKVPTDWGAGLGPCYVAYYVMLDGQFQVLRAPRVFASSSPRDCLGRYSALEGVEAPP